MTPDSIIIGRLHPEKELHAPRQCTHAIHTVILYSTQSVFRTQIKHDKLQTLKPCWQIISAIHSLSLLDTVLESPFCVTHAFMVTLHTAPALELQQIFEIMIIPLLAVPVQPYKLTFLSLFIVKFRYKLALLDPRTFHCYCVHCQFYCYQAKYRSI